MVETMHRLHIVDPAVLYRLPPEIQAMHLAHVRNDIGGRYNGSDPPAQTPPATHQHRPRGTDMMAVFKAIADHRSAPPSEKALRYARQVLSIPSAPAALRADAQATLDAAGVS
jgi:hypothetical protein